MKIINKVKKISPFKGRYLNISSYLENVYDSLWLGCWLCWLCWLGCFFFKEFNQSEMSTHLFIIDPQVYII